MLPFEAVELGFLNENEVIPTFIVGGNRHLVPKSFPRGESVIKPWLGHGGKGVEKIAAPASPKAWQMMQPLLPVEKTGDRRVFFLNGQRIGDFVRYPAEGKIQANLAQGGRAALQDLSKKESAICEKVGQFLQEKGILFAGIDLLGERLSEVNITSPTGFAALAQLGGPRLAVNYLNFAEELL
jgi:glutathione synthase